MLVLADISGVFRPLWDALLPGDGVTPTAAPRGLREDPERLRGAITEGIEVALDVDVMP